MKKISISFLVFILILFFNNQEIEAAKKFTDVNSYSEEINYLTEMYIITGYEDGTFQPNRPVTNAQVAVMLSKALKLDLRNPPDPKYKDVPKTHAAYKAIAAAAEKGLFPKGKYFYPSEKSTRQSVARAIAIGFNLKGDMTISFTDVASSNKYKEYISMLASNKITSGYSDGSFKPSNEISRAHFSVLVARSMNQQFKLGNSRTLTVPELVAMHDKRVVTIETDQGSGSGVLVGNGLVLTNEHVILGMDEGDVFFENGDVVSILGIVAKDSDKDLALVKLSENIQLEKVHRRPFEQLVKGEKVVAIGSPYGLMNSVSEGLISGLRYFDEVKTIQTTVFIDSGSSGGGLFDLKGNLVGITTSGYYEGSSNLNFAVSISEIEQWESILSKPYESIGLLPKEELEEEEEEVYEIDSDLFRGMSPGMTKVEVKEVEAVLVGNLIEENETTLLYENAYYYGFPARVKYLFENDKLKSMEYSFIDLEEYDSSDLELFFFVMLGQLESELGETNLYDDDWVIEGKKSTLKAKWDNGYDVTLTVDKGEGNKASIVIISN